MKFSYKKKGDDVHIDADGSVSEVAIALSMMKDSGGGVVFHGPEAPVVQRAVEHLFPIAGEIELPMPQLPPQRQPPVGYPGSPPMPMPALPPAQEYPAIAPSQQTQMPVPVPTAQVYPHTREEAEVTTILRSLDRVTGLQTPVPYPVPTELPTRIQSDFPTRVAPTRPVRVQKPKSKIETLLDSTISNWVVGAIVVGLTCLYVYRDNLPMSGFLKSNPTPSPSPSSSPAPGEAQLKNNINPIPFPPRIK